jgi:hypothetical protein
MRIDKWKARFKCNAMWYGACIEQILKEGCIYNIFFLKNNNNSCNISLCSFIYFFLSLYQNKLFTFYVFSLFLCTFVLIRIINVSLWCMDARRQQKCYLIDLLIVFFFFMNKNGVMMCLFVYLIPFLYHIFSNIYIHILKTAMFYID